VVLPEGKTCDSGPDGLFAEFRADPDGTFTRTVTLHTEVQTTDGPLDCGAPGACDLVAGNRDEWGAERTAVPIDFGGVGGGLVAAPGARALAFTGAGGATVPSAVIGLVLLLAGAALVLLARRRRA
jgi:hypothetical protein